MNENLLEKKIQRSLSNEDGNSGEDDTKQWI